jgi:hypothetical protein
VLSSSLSAIRSAPRIVHRCCAIDADAIHARLCLGGVARRLRRHEGIDGVQSLPGHGRAISRAKAPAEFLKIRPWRLQLARWVLLFGVFLLGQTDDKGPGARAVGPVHWLC